MRRLSEYGSVAYLVERPTGETRAEQYSDTVLTLQTLRLGWAVLGVAFLFASLERREATLLLEAGQDMPSPSTMRIMACL